MIAGGRWHTFLLKYLLNLFFSIIMRWSHLVACSGLGLPVWSYPCSRVLGLLLWTALPCNLCGPCLYLIACLWSGSGCLSWYWLPEVTLNFETTDPPPPWITVLPQHHSQFMECGRANPGLLCARQTLHLPVERSLHSYMLVYFICIFIF